MWIYCGGRTTESVVAELEKYRVVKGYIMVEDVLNCTEGINNIQGIIVTDMSLSTLLDWEEIRKLSSKFKGVQVLSVTTREGGVPDKGNLPVNVGVKKVDKIRIDRLVDLMGGGR